MVAIAASHFSEERADSELHVEERTGEVARLIASRADEYVRRTEVILQSAALLAHVCPPDIPYNRSLLTAVNNRTVGKIGTLNIQAGGGGNIGTSNPVL